MKLTTGNKRYEAFPMAMQQWIAKLIGTVVTDHQGWSVTSLCVLPVSRIS
jgi:hypothetical protein